MFKVSIIMACYNVDAFIEDAFESIVRQSAFAQFEVIPVNDGSTDRTWEIIQEYQKRYPDNFFPITFDKGSGGPGRPRNAGLERATSEYVIFMDPDDRIYKDGYSKLLQSIEKYGSDVVIATRYGVKEKSDGKNPVWVDWMAEKPYVNQNSYEVKLDLLSQRPVILKTIYRRDLIEQYGLRFLEGVSSSEDEIFDKKYLLLSQKITKINDVVYLYTVARTGSITSKIRIKVYEDLVPIFAGLDDALSVYFNEAIVAYRVAALLRTFYLPKLLLLDPGLTDQALELCREACEAFGFDRLLLTANNNDRRIVELIRDRQYSQLMLFFMNLRTGAANRRNRVQAKRLKDMERRPVKLALKASNLVGLSRKAAREEGGLGKLWATRIRKNLAGAPNGYWVFMDRREKAADNGEALYRYVRDNRIHDKIAFVIRQDSPDYQRLIADGFNVIAYNSLEHWRLHYNCEYFFASHVDDVIIKPWASYGVNEGKPRYKLVFLQHGIIRSDLSGWLGAKKYHLFCASAKREFDSVINNVRYGLGPNQVKLTGLARHDLLEAKDGDYVLVSPTWRSFLAEATEAEFRDSEFFRNWHQLIHDPAVRNAMTAAGVRLKLVLHSSISQFAHCFDEDEHVEVVKFSEVPSFAELLSAARMLVTDYSTISFDMLYLRRPVVYYTFPELQKHSTNTGADLDLYAELGTRVEDPAAAVAALVAAAERGFRNEDEKVRAADGFFAYEDRQNRKRIIDAVLEGTAK
ncbi:glycosyltransferase [Actinoplanes oblitus]|uniref:Glycosyltransferase n=1 Tax=Actinoplanes oblitus TaxID=3040509 RepID=A0ABY8WHE8_9ACTN|nr:glycosyltransferase [Actinoplanes oblitus]WIM95938.1 glycosyltransferase [Actinoplanes oblitus]